jgi:histidinol dehydrogenase
MAENIQKFAEAQLASFKSFESEMVTGVFASQKIEPIERVGIYVPGGKFPLVSTLLMCAIPARVANVSEIQVCSPPSYRGTIHPAILVASDMVEVQEIYKIGGVQAIAAMAYGTKTVQKVDKIVGPGNKYVMLAKREVYGDVGIDLIAGPTEIIIIADGTADPEILAADMLSQAEHDVEAWSVLITDSITIAKEVMKEIARQLEGLETANIARKSIEENSLIILTENMKEAVDIANKKAPEHISLHLENPDEYSDKLKNFGSLFIGKYTSQVLGDYSSGINHTLPTNRSARFTGGLNVGDFLKVQTTLKVTKEGFQNIGLLARDMAIMEGLSGHARSIEIRMEK